MSEESEAKDMQPPSEEGEEPSPPPEKAEFYILTSENCPHCQSAKERLKKYIEDGMLRELCIEKDEKAIEIAKKLNVTAVPSFLKKEGGKICLLNEDMKPERCIEEEP